MNLGDQIRRGALWLFGGQLATRAIEFAIGIVLARLLVPADFGSVSIVYAFTGLVGLVAGGGLGQALIRSAEADTRDYRVIFTAQLAIGVVIFLSLYAGAPLLERLYGDPLLKDLLRVSAVSFLFRPLGNLPSALLSREMRFGAQALAKAVALIAYGTVATILALKGFGPWALVLGGLASAPAQYAVLRQVSRWPAGLSFDFARWRRHAGIGIRFSFNDMADYAREQAPKLIVGHMAGTAPLGLFNRGQGLARLPFGLVAGSLYQPLFRALSSEQHNLDRSRYLYRRAIAVSAAYTLPAGAALGVGALEFLVLLLGEKWAGSAPLLQGFCLLLPLQIVTNTSGAVVAAQARLTEEIRIHLTALVLVAIGCVIGLRFGLYGALIAVAVSFTYTTVAITRLAADALRMRWTDGFRSLGPAVPLTLACLASDLLARALLPIDFIAEPLRQPVLLVVPAATGLLAAMLALLMSPHPELASERARWRGLVAAALRWRAA